MVGKSSAARGRFTAFPPNLERAPALGPRAAHADCRMVNFFRQASLPGPAVSRLGENGALPCPLTSGRAGLSSAAGPSVSAQLPPRFPPPCGHTAQFRPQAAPLPRVSLPSSGAPDRVRRLRDSMRLGAVLLASLAPASGQCGDHGHCEPLRERIDHPIHYGARYSVGPPVPGFGLRLNRSEDISMRGQHLGYFTGR